MTKKLKCAVFISDEGFGHMVRQRAIISELIKIIIDAQSLGLELGSEYVCKKYQNQRYFDVFSFYQITDKLNSLFMLHNNGIKQLRQIGFNIIDNSRILKSKISHYAMGLDQ